MFILDNRWSIVTTFLISSIVHLSHVLYRLELFMVLMIIIMIMTRVSSDYGGTDILVTSYTTHVPSTTGRPVNFNMDHRFG